MTTQDQLVHRPGTEWTRRKHRSWHAFGAVSVVALTVSFFATAADASTPKPSPIPTASYIVESSTTTNATSAVRSSGGVVENTIPPVHAVVATLSGAEATLLGGLGLDVVKDSTVKMQGFSSRGGSSRSLLLPQQTASSTGGSSSSGASDPVSGGCGATGTQDCVYPQVTDATQLWSQGDEGQGVTVAVLDTGIDASLPALSGRVIGGVDLSGGNDPDSDGYGHGTFVAGLIASDQSYGPDNFQGEAPEADLVSIKVAGADGVTSESTVIAGVEWAIAHESQYDIRVLNLSLGVLPDAPTALDPLDQAVEQAWNAGITVVASAGNFGPDNGTITSPGDDPLVITVGALDDDGQTSPANFSVPAFSSVGPTRYDGWFKPDLIAPGKSVVSLADPGSTVYDENPSAEVGATNFVGSGTSFSTAIVSGAAALVLSQHPNLNPDEVKARLLGTTTPGPVGNPLVDGHGILDANAAALAPPMTLNQQAAASAESSNPPNDISLANTWSVSTWNGAAWNGAAWNGAAWNGAAWNGAAWNGAAWNGAAWNGAAWNGAAWNGAAWNGAAWNVAYWEGAAWNGAAWNGAAWNGAAWNGAAWNGAAWNGAAWNGAAWNVDDWS